MRPLIIIALFLAALVVTGVAQETASGSAKRPGATPGVEAASQPPSGVQTAGGEDCRAGGPGCDHRCQEFCKEHCETPCKEHCGQGCPDQCREYCRDNCKRAEGPGGDCKRRAPPWMVGLPREQQRAERLKLESMDPEARQTYMERKLKAWLLTLTPEEQEAFGRKQRELNEKRGLRSPGQQDSMRPRGRAAGVPEGPPR